MKVQPSATEITQDQIDAWIEKHGEVHLLEVSDAVEAFDPYKIPDENTPIVAAVTGYLRKPTDRELSHAMSKLPVLIEAGKVIVKNCWLAGDDRILEESALLTSAALQALPLLEIRQAALKKLKPSGK